MMSTESYRHSTQFREGHKERFEKAAQEKLFLPRNKEGEPNEKAAEVVRMFSEALAQYPDFVGVTLRGSSVLGYGDETSDIDISILYDRKAEQKKMALTVATDTLERSITRGQSHPKLHLSYYDVGSETLKEEIEQDSNLLPDAFASLCELAVGERLDEYRERAGALIRSLPQVEKDAFEKRVVGALVFYEEQRFGRMQWRITDNHGTWDKDTFIKVRTELWTKRVKDIFKINE